MTAFTFIPSDNDINPNISTLNDKALPFVNLTTCKGKCFGYSLIEVLVSMFILAFGMLGVAKLQLNSLQNVQSAHFNNQATLLTGKILEQIAANPEVILHYQLQNNDTVISPINCKTNNCGAALLAKFDLQQWQQQLANKLPSGRGEINTTSNSAQVIIRWDSKRNGALGTQCPPMSDADLACLKINRQFH